MAACLVLQPSFAEDPQSTNPDLEEITVTAHRIEAPAVVPTETLPSDTIEDAGNLIGPASLAPLTSLALSRSGAFGSQAQVRVRGAEANHLQVLVDGIEVNDPATGSEFAFAHLDLAAIDRIEFLPGAQSALWGSDALAGVLQLLSASEADKRELELAAGSNQERLARLDLGDQLTAGHYRLAVTDYETQGTNTALEGDEDDGYAHRSAHFSGRFSRGDLGVNLVLRQVEASSEFDPSGFPTYLPRDGDNETDVQFQAGKIGIDGIFLDGRLKQSIELKGLATSTTTDADGARVSRFEGTRATLTSVSHWLISRGHALTGLVERETEGFRQRAAASFFGDPNFSQSTRSQSVALEYLMSGQRISASLSGRRDTHTDFEDIASYRAALRFAPSERVSLFANLGTGTKNPSFIERFGYTPDSFIGNPNLRPEFNRHVSLGLDWRVRDAAGLRVTLFRDELEDEINGFAWTGSGFTATNLDQSSERSGIEVRAKLELAQIKLEASYTMVDSNAPDGTTEVRRPRHQGYLSASRQFLARRLSITLAARFSGENLDLDFSTGQQRVVDLPGRELLRFTARYTLNKAVEAYLRLDNLLDDDGQEVYGYAPPGRSASLGIRLRW